MQGNKAFRDEAFSLKEAFFWPVMDVKNLLNASHAIAFLDPPALLMQEKWPKLASEWKHIQVRNVEILLL